MRCPSCDHDNRPDRRFCAQCGVPLDNPCAACGTQNDPGANFCGSCGKPLSGAPVPAPSGIDRRPRPAATPDDSGLAAERRQLTVMFCDLVGSTDLSQRLDAEDLRSVVRTYQEAAAQAIDRYAGHIAQYLGDGLLVYFGYPQAHEDDAERAVRAGLEILTALRTLNDTLEPKHAIRLAARVGIHTGPVVIGAMGGGAKSEVLALGDTTNVAARLEAVAASNAVVISGATQRLVPGMFLLQDLGTPPLKGIATPLRAYAVLQPTGVRSRLDVDPSTLTPLVGRDQELGLLIERWEQTQESDGQAVLIAGEAGLGKSRLLQAFRERLAATPHTWLECRCTPYTQGSAFHPLIELVQQGLGFKPDADPDTKLRRLEAGIAYAKLAAPEVVRLIAALLALPLPARYPPLQQSPELQRKLTMEALVAWTLALAEQQPLVMLYEDLHWCDPSTVELLGLLLAQSPTAKVLTLLTFRPSFAPPWPARSHLTPLAVNRLSRRQATNMIGGVTRGVPLPDVVVQRIVERADGVPLFVEEVTKMVLESGLVAARDGRYELTGPLTDLAIPTTLQDSLMARLDRLDKGKEVAQLGAALGREFHYELLRSVSLQEEPRLHAGLAQLVDAELLYQRGAPPAATYTFKHALIQDTAYQSLLKSTRLQFHQRIAQVLTERFPEVVANQPELVARHYTEGGLGMQAIDYWYMAGQRAVQCSANLEAIGYLGKALGLLAAAPVTGARTHVELALQTLLGLALMSCKGYGAPEVEAAFRRARELCHDLGEAAQPFPVLRGLWAFAIVRGRLSEARGLAGELLDTARRAGDDALLLEAYYALGCTLFYLGEPCASLTWSEQGIALYDPALHRSHTQLYGADPGITCRCYAALALWQLGHPDQALARIFEARAIAEETAQAVNIAFALTFGAVVYQLRGEVEATRAWADADLVLATEQVLPFWASLARIFRGWVWGKEGSSERGIAEIERGLAENHAAGAEVGRPQNCALLAEAFAARGDSAVGLAALAEAFDAVATTGARYQEAELHHLRGEILLTRTAQGSGDAVYAEAEACFRSGIEVARRQEARSLELRAATSLARLWQRQGKQDAARALLAPLYDWFTEGFDTRDLQDAKALLEELA